MKPPRKHVPAQGRKESLDDSYTSGRKEERGEEGTNVGGVRQESALQEPLRDTKLLPIRTSRPRAPAVEFVWEISDAQGLKRSPAGSERSGMEEEKGEGESDIPMDKQSSALQEPLRDPKLFLIGTGTLAPPKRTAWAAAGAQRSKRSPADSEIFGREEVKGEEESHLQTDKQEKALREPLRDPKLFPIRTSRPAAPPPGSR